MSFGINQFDEQHWQLIFDHAPIGIGLVGLDGTWLKVNERIQEIIGYSESELLKLKFQDITHPADLDADEEMLAKLNAGKISSYMMIKRYITKDQKIVWIRLNVSAVKKDGHIIYYVSHIQPLINGEKIQAESLTKNWYKFYAPDASLDFTKIIAKNWKYFITIGLFIVSTVIPIGVSFYTAQYKIDRIYEREAELINLLRSIKNDGNN